MTSFYLEIDEQQQQIVASWRAITLTLRRRRPLWHKPPSRSVGWGGGALIQHTGLPCEQRPSAATDVSVTDRRKNDVC